MPINKPDTSAPLRYIFLSEAFKQESGIDEFIARAERARTSLVWLTDHTVEALQTAKQSIPQRLHRANSIVVANTMDLMTGSAALGLSAFCAIAVAQVQAHDFADMSYTHGLKGLAHKLANCLG